MSPAFSLQQAGLGLLGIPQSISGGLPAVLPESAENLDPSEFTASSRASIGGIRGVLDLDSPLKESILPLNMSFDFPKKQFAIDPASFLINECMRMSLAMRKSNRWSQSGVAAILGSRDLFGEQDALISNLNISSSLRLGQAGASSQHAYSSTPVNARAPSAVNPLHSSFLQLRTILAEASDISSIDSLTLMQPFLLTIESSTTSGNVTALALKAVGTLLDYDVISYRSRNFPATLIQITTSLTHCRFEASDQNTDDSVLLKVLRLLESIVVGPLSVFLPNSVISEVIHTCLSLACNKRRSEVLRRAAEMTVVSITVRVFSRLRELVPEAVFSEEIHRNYSELHADVIGSGVRQLLELDHPASGAPEKDPTDMTLSSPTKASSSEVIEKQFDIQSINEFLGLLISMITPKNQYQHMESTRVFALSLITTALEVSGDVIPDHPSLLALVADPISKDVLQIISSTDSPALLQASLRLFCTMSVTLGSRLKSQNELAFNLLFKSVLPDKKDSPIKGNTTSVLTRIPSSKELIVEHFSFLWTRSPSFFSQIFVEYDCDFERSDLASTFVEFLSTLALPESALITTDNVPPICLEGVLSFVSGIHERVRSFKPVSINSTSTNQLVLDKMRKNLFIKCTDLFNENPKKGVEALMKEGFISDGSDLKELASFFFKRSTRLNKKVLGEYLAKPANSKLLREFMFMFDFAGLRVDEALRMILKAFRLPGESQQIERIVEHFADAYVSCEEEGKNDALQDEDSTKEKVTPDREAVFVLSYSIIMLNTDLHNPQVKKQMELESYRKNLRGIYNGKDFPEWYLASIYKSINEQEIIMPEEHHGTEKWYDDVWHNLISSQSKYARDHANDVSVFDLETLCHFDRLFFSSVVDIVIETLIKVFVEASDDNIITKLISSIDKCASICIYFSLDEPIDRLISFLSKLSTLSNAKQEDEHSQDGPKAEIPITEITIPQKERSIVVSELAVKFGRDFKAQLSTIVLFRLIRKPECKVFESWDYVFQIVLNLFENCLVNPNLFSEFQKKLRLEPLERVKPGHVIPSSTPNEEYGILSTFSSFLKSYSDQAPEPTELEIEATLSTIDCVGSVNVQSIFDSVSRSSPAEMKIFVEILVRNLPVYSDEKKRYFGSEILFIFEIAVCFTLILNDSNVTESVTSKLLEYMEVPIVSESSYVRLCTYFFLLARQGAKENVPNIVGCLEKLLGLETELIASHGASIVEPLFSLVDPKSQVKSIIEEQSFWQMLRYLASQIEYAEEILTFAESIVDNSFDEISAVNYGSLLDLLDDLSSLGAVGAQWGNNTSDSKNPDEQIQKIVELSKRSVELTGKISTVHHRLSNKLIQAVAHQCFNPCAQVRGRAVQVLQATIFSSILNPEVKAVDIFESGLFPLLAELQRETSALSEKNGFPDTHLQIF